MKLNNDEIVHPVLLAGHMTRFDMGSNLARWLDSCCGNSWGDHRSHIGKGFMFADVKTRAEVLQEACPPATMTQLDPDLFTMLHIMTSYTLMPLSFTRAFGSNGVFRAGIARGSVVKSHMDSGRGGEVVRVWDQVFQLQRSSGTSWVFRCRVLLALESMSP